jgi:hypothetical protein
MSTIAVSARDNITTYARSNQISVVTGRACFRVDGRRWYVQSTEFSWMTEGYSALMQHRRDGEYVFAFESSYAVTAHPRVPQEPSIELEVGQPFVYAGLAVSGVYAFERQGRRRLVLVAQDDGSAPAMTATA